MALYISIDTDAKKPVLIYYDPSKTIPIGFIRKAMDGKIRKMKGEKADIDYAAYGTEEEYKYDITNILKAVEDYEVYYSGSYWTTEKEENPIFSFEDGGLIYRGRLVLRVPFEEFYFANETSPKFLPPNAYGSYQIKMTKDDVELELKQ